MLQMSKQYEPEFKKWVLDCSLLVTIVGVLVNMQW